MYGQSRSRRRLHRLIGNVREKYPFQKIFAGIIISAIILAATWWMFEDELFYTVVRHCNWTRQCVPPRVLDNPHPRIGIIMSYETDYYAQLGVISEMDKRQYAERHGYQFWVNHEKLDENRKPSWYKVLMAQRHLHEVDWLFYVDTDTLIMEHDRPITDFLDDRYDLIFTEDHRGLNAGVWMIKDTVWSDMFLREWYERGERFVVDVNEPGKSGDQDTLKFLMGVGKEQEGLEEERLMDRHLHMKVLPQCAFNSYPYWRGSWDGVYMAGDFLVHLAGKGSAALRAHLFEAFKNHHYYSVIRKSADPEPDNRPGARPSDEEEPEKGNEE